MDNIWLAFLLTLVAGLSTGVGGALALFTKRKNKKFLAVSLGFSAGVMIYVSMIELFKESSTVLGEAMGDKTGMIVTVASFFGGMFLIALIDKFIPAKDNPHELKNANKALVKQAKHDNKTSNIQNIASGELAADSSFALKNPSIDNPWVLPKESENSSLGAEETLALPTADVSETEGVGDASQADKQDSKKGLKLKDKVIAKTLDAQTSEDAAAMKKLKKSGILTALAIAIHNFPEGIATFIAALQEPSVAIPIVVAIAIHNIPEGISIAVPIYFSTGSKKKAFFYSLFSGLAEPLGAVVGYLILMPFLNDIAFGVIFAVVAGIMVFISIDELLPSAREYGEHHLSIYGLVAGMAVMAVSLILFM